MTTHERVHAVADYGFTERQARFLVLVMRHSGLCVKRQYAAFAGVKPGGEKCNAFFDKLVRRGYAVGSDCIHNRARLYHIHHKPLYHAIGEPESRYRRAVPAGRAMERLMRFDAALLTPELDWLTTRAEKLAFLAATSAPESSESPREGGVQDRRDQFPGTLPIGIDGTGRAVLRIERVPRVIERTALSKATLWRLVRAGLFPAPRRITGRAIGWLDVEVTDWITSRKPRQAA